MAAWTLHVLQKYDFQQILIEKSNLPAIGSWKIYILLVFRIDFLWILLFCNWMTSISEIPSAKIHDLQNSHWSADVAIVFYAFHTCITDFARIQSFQHIKTTDSISWLKHLQVFSFQMNNVNDLSLAHLKIQWISSMLAR